MRDKKLLIYRRDDLHNDFYDLSLEKIQLRHLNSIEFRRLHPAGILAFIDKDRAKIFIKHGKWLIDPVIIPVDEVPELITEEFL